MLTPKKLAVGATTSYLLWKEADWDNWHGWNGKNGKTT